MSDVIGSAELDGSSGADVPEGMLATVMLELVSEIEVAAIAVPPTSEAQPATTRAAATPIAAAVR